MRRSSHRLLLAAAVLSVGTHAATSQAAYDDPSGSAPAFPKLLSASAGGTFTRAQVVREEPFRILTEQPKHASTPRLRVRLDAAPAVVVVKLERRNNRGRYVALKGRGKFTAESTVTLLKPSGSWSGKRLEPGAYRFVFMTPDPPIKYAAFTQR